MKKHQTRRLIFAGTGASAFLAWTASLLISFSPTPLHAAPNFFGGTYVTTVDNGGFLQVIRNNDGTYTANFGTFGNSQTVNFGSGDVSAAVFADLENCFLNNVAFSSPEDTRDAIIALF